jgi:hypothetical protein
MTLKVVFLTSFRNGLQNFRSPRGRKCFAIFSVAVLSNINKSDTHPMTGFWDYILITSSAEFFLGGNTAVQFLILHCTGIDVITEFQSSCFFVFNKAYKRQGPCLVVMWRHSVAGMREHCIRCGLSFSFSVSFGDRKTSVTL